MTSIDSGTTLDIRPTPGRDTRFAATSSDSAFTFGTFRLENNITNPLVDNVSGSTLSYGSYATLENTKTADFDIVKVITTKSNELNLKPEEATSYAYFGSFYTKVANAINNIIDIQY